MLLNYAGKLRALKAKMNALINKAISSSQKKMMYIKSLLILGKHNIIVSNLPFDLNNNNNDKDKAFTLTLIKKRKVYNSA